MKTFVEWMTIKETITKKQKMGIKPPPARCELCNQPIGGIKRKVSIPGGGPPKIVCQRCLADIYMSQ